MSARTTPGQCESADESPGAVVLVVDDAAVADALALLLKVTGHDPIVAAGFDEARHVLLAAERMPDVIVCDVRLARGESGFETIEGVRRLAARSIPAILVTSGDTWSTMPERRARIDDCYWLSKPFDGDALLALVAATSLRPGGEST